MNPFSKISQEQKSYPIMGYVYELENKVRKLQWQLQCHRLGSFTSGMVIGIIIVVVFQRIFK